MPEIPVTQILSFAFDKPPTAGLRDDGQWSKILDLVERGAEVQRVYWGRSHEHPEYAQLHVVRENLDQHRKFLGSRDFQEFLTALEQFASTPRRPIIRHAQLKSWGPDDQSLARGAPFVGTAIYLDTGAPFHEGAWPLWTHIVRHVDGCLGGCGGPLLEPVETIPGLMGEMVNPEQPTEKFEKASLVYVGWKTIKQHENYHHTQHFAEHSIILNCANNGFAEYGHTVFEGSRERSGGEKGAKL